MPDFKEDKQKEPKQKKHILRRKLSGKKLSVQHFMKKKHIDISNSLSPELQENLGKIDEGFDMFIFGGSGSGKSSFAAILIREFSQFGKTLHLVYEEGHSSSVQMNLKRAGIEDIKGYEIMDNCSHEDLMYLLNKKKSPHIIVIDSLQYARFTKPQWLALKDKFVKGRKKKIFIVISHADGKRPRGSVATDALYDAQIKVFVKGKIAFIKSRYEGKKNYVIYEKGAREYWGRQYKTMLTKQIF
jgi:KaiC/GvpD/RAD55 family RecA-like ATPase